MGELHHVGQRTTLFTFHFVFIISLSFKMAKYSAARHPALLQIVQDVWGSVIFVRPVLKQFSSHLLSRSFGDSSRNKGVKHGFPFMLPSFHLPLPLPPALSDTFFLFSKGSPFIFHISALSALLFAGNLPTNQTFHFPDAASLANHSSCADTSSVSFGYDSCIQVSRMTFSPAQQLAV